MESETQTDWAMDDPIISELLCLISFVIPWIDCDMLIKLCVETFKQSDIVCDWGLLKKTCA